MRNKKLLAARSPWNGIYPTLNILGSAVNIKDVKGNELHIGDAIKIFDKYNNLDKCLTIVRFKREDTINYNINLDSINGVCKDGSWYVLDKKYTELSLGDIVDMNKASALEIVEIELKRQ